MSFQLIFAGQLEADLKPLPKNIQERILHAVRDRLSLEPDKFGKPLARSLKGLWSMRVGDWRVIYKISGQDVIILRVGHRREIYRFAAILTALWRGR